MKSLSTLPIKLPLIKGRPSVPAAKVLQAKAKTDLATLNLEINLSVNTARSTDHFLSQVKAKDNKSVDLDKSSGNVVLSKPALRNTNAYYAEAKSAILTTAKNGDISFHLEQPKRKLEYRETSKGKVYTNSDLGREYRFSADGKTITIMEYSDKG